MKPTAKPVTGVPVAGSSASAWSSGLFDCFDDYGLCCLTRWCLCITFGWVVEIVDRGATSCGMSRALYALLVALTGCQCIYSCTYHPARQRQERVPLRLRHDDQCHPCTSSTQACASSLSTPGRNPRGSASKSGGSAATRSDPAGTKYHASNASSSYRNAPSLPRSATSAASTASTSAASNMST